MEYGVYDLYPKAKKDQLSGLNIKTFVLQDVTRIQALVALDMSPEVQSWRSRHREYGGVLISQTGFPQTQRRVGIAMDTERPMGTWAYERKNKYGSAVCIRLCQITRF
jgi:hypothetical protein